MSQEPCRTTREVFEDHLQLAMSGEVERDLERNLAPDVVRLTSFGVFRGRGGAHEAAELLERQVPHARYVYRTRLVEGEIAFLEWTAKGDGDVEDGADSFLIRNGQIQVMTIHYTVIRS